MSSDNARPDQKIICILPGATTGPQPIRVVLGRMLKHTVLCGVVAVAIGAIGGAVAAPAARFVPVHVGYVVAAGWLAGLSICVHLLVDAAQVANIAVRARRQGTTFRYMFEAVIMLNLDRYGDPKLMSARGGQFEYGVYAARVLIGSGLVDASQIRLDRLTDP
jgi:hypothetical protein